MKALTEKILTDYTALTEAERELLLLEMLEKSCDILCEKRGRIARCATGLDKRQHRKARHLNTILETADIVIIAYKLGLFDDPRFDLNAFQDALGYEEGYADALLQTFYDCTPLPYFSADLTRDPSEIFTSERIAKSFAEFRRELFDESEDEN